MGTHLFSTCLILLVFFSAGVVAEERPCDAQNVLVSGSASITHKTGDEYGGTGSTEAAFDILTTVFIMDHLAIGGMAAVRDNDPQEWWDNWSVGPVVALYADPNTHHPSVAGSVLPFVRVFGLIGKTELYLGNTTHTIGGDFGFAVMAGEHLSIDIAMRLSHEWIRDVRPFRWGEFGPPPPYDIKSKTIRMSFGLSGFIG